MPIRHFDSECFDRDTVARWIQYLFDHNTVCFHNSLYDLGWMATELKIRMPEKFHDSQIMAAMLDENRVGQFNLDAVCKWRGVPGKDESKLKEAAAAFGVDPKAEMWKLPAKFVGIYAEDDAQACLEAVKSMLPDIREEGLEEAYQVELDLIPLLYEMRRRGIRIDSDAAEQAIIRIESQRDDLLKDLSRRTGISLDMKGLGSSSVKQELFDAENIVYPITPKTKKGSFKSKWMEKQNHWLPRQIVEINRLHRLATVFIRGHILDSMHLGRIHSEMHSTNSDSGGTRSSRFSYSHPPLQQMPSRITNEKEKEAVIAVRSCFLPEEDSVWGAFDYSQQEYRMTVHFAGTLGLKGGEEAVQAYKDNPDLDYHDMVKDWCKIDRGQAKIINFGILYDKRVNSLAEDLGMSIDEAQDLLNKYDTYIPFAKPLHNRCENAASRRGFIRLIDGARCHFNLWDCGYDPNSDSLPCGYDVAMERVNNPSHGWYKKVPRRANTRTALNRLIQGSSARQTKHAMVQCWKEGILPMLQMHDELDFSVDDQSVADRAVEIMKTAVTILVPMEVDQEYGRSWGQAASLKFKSVAEVQ